MPAGFACKVHEFCKQLPRVSQVIAPSFACNSHEYCLHGSRAVQVSLTSHTSVSHEPHKHRSRVFHSNCRRIFSQLGKKYCPVRKKLLPNWEKNGKELPDEPVAIPEAGSDVYQFVGRTYPVQALIGGRLAQPSQMPDVGAYLDIVETASANSW